MLDNDCIHGNTLGLCTAGVEDIFENSQITEDIVKKISFNVPVLGEIGENYGIFRFNGDLSILEKLKPHYRKDIFETDTNKLKKGVVQIDSNDTVQIKIKDAYFTFIKRSDYHLLNNPYGETFDAEGEEGKIYRDAQRNFITETFLKVFQKTENNAQYLSDFYEQVLKEYIAKENKYSQLVTEKYSNEEKFFDVILNLDTELKTQKLVNSEILTQYREFIESKKTEIISFYNRPKPAKKEDLFSYEMQNKKLKNVPLQLFVDLLQSLSDPTENKIVQQLQKIHTNKDIQSENNIITKIKKFSDKEKLNQLQKAKLLILALSAHDPHTALEHSITMTNDLQAFLGYKPVGKELTVEEEIFGKKLEGQEKNDLINELLLGFILHDIGKLFVSSILLRKKGPIKETRFQGKTEDKHIDEHALFGKEILALLDYNQAIIDLAQYHHPKKNLTSETKMSTPISFIELIEMFDIYNALQSDRGYKQSFEQDEALVLLNRITAKDVRESIREYFEEFITSMKNKSPL